MERRRKRGCVKKRTRVAMRLPPWTVPTDRNRRWERRKGGVEKGKRGDG